MTDYRIQSKKIFIVYDVLTLDEMTNMFREQNNKTHLTRFFSINHYKKDNFHNHTICEFSQKIYLNSKKTKVFMGHEVLKISSMKSSFDKCVCYLYKHNYNHIKFNYLSSFIHFNMINHPLYIIHNKSLKRTYKFLIFVFNMKFNEIIKLLQSRIDHNKGLYNKILKEKQYWNEKEILEYINTYMSCLTALKKTTLITGNECNSLDEVLKQLKYDYNILESHFSLKNFPLARQLMTKLKYNRLLIENHQFSNKYLKYLNMIWDYNSDNIIDASEE